MGKQGDTIPVTKRSDDAMFVQGILAAILCRTYKNPITGDALAEGYGVDLRQITTIVSNARKKRIKIASSKGGRDEYLGVKVEAGYYQARTPEEMRSTADMIHGTAMELLKLEKDLMDFGNVQPSVWEQGPIGEPDKDAA
jgi:hypothetical protein